MSKRGPTTRNGATSDWTEDRVAQLTQLWADGVSCSRIAAAIGGITKNSVIGKVQRLGLPGRKPKVTQQLGRPKTQIPKAKKSQVVRPRQSRLGHRIFTAEPQFEIEKPDGNAWEPIEGTTPLPLELLGNNQCRWPVTDDRPFLFCGAEATHGSYCRHHHLWSIGQGTPFERSAVRKAELAAWQERYVAEEQEAA